MIKTIKENYQKVVETIHELACRNGRAGSQVTLVAVTKFQSIELIKEAIKAGAIHFGENYADQAVEKILALEHNNIKWHMIGHVQSRKAVTVVEHFNYVHTIDSLKIARKLSEKAASLGKTIDCLVELNIANEVSKSGYQVIDGSPSRQLTDDLMEMNELSGIQMNGLMIMPPLGVHEELARTYFCQAREILDITKEIVRSETWKELSMGTSSDYQLAIECGSTMVRIGTSIFGERNTR